MTPQPLSDAEFDRLSSSLQHYGSKRASNLEQLDGFLSALVCGPEEVPTHEYLPKIWAYDIVKEDALSAQPLLQECVSLIRRHRDFILQTLESGNVFTPLSTFVFLFKYTAFRTSVGILRQSSSVNAAPFSVMVQTPRSLLSMAPARFKYVFAHASL